MRSGWVNEMKRAGENAVRQHERDSRIVHSILGIVFLGLAAGSYHHFEGKTQSIRDHFNDARQSHRTDCIAAVSSRQAIQNTAIGNITLNVQNFDVEACMTMAANKDIGERERDRNVFSGFLLLAALSCLAGIISPTCDVKRDIIRREGEQNYRDHGPS